jgi:hypothetical protein
MLPSSEQSNIFASFRMGAGPAAGEAATRKRKAAQSEAAEEDTEENGVEKENGSPASAARPQVQALLQAGKKQAKAKPKNKEREGTGDPALYEGVGLAEKLSSPGQPVQPLRLIIVGHNPSAETWKQGHV